MDMKIISEKINQNTILITILGCVDELTVNIFQQRLLEEYNNGIIKFKINLESVDIFGSWAAGALYKLLRKLQEKNITTIAIYCPKELIRKGLSLLTCTRFYNIFSNKDSFNQFDNFYCQ